jgi:hypothetical protein
VSVEGVSGDAGRWGDRYSAARKAEIERKQAEAPQAFDVALRYGTGATRNKALDPRVDVPKTTDGLDRLTTAQRNAVLNRNVAPPPAAETTAMAPQPLSAEEMARRRALDAIAAYRRNSSPS